MVQQHQGLFHHVPSVQEGQQQRAGNAALAHGDCNFNQRPQIVAAIHLARIQHLLGNGAEGLGHEEGAQGHKNGGQRQGKIGIAQPRRIQHHIVGHQRHL